MANSIKLIRAAFGSVAIIGSAVLGVSVMTDTFAASKAIYKTNFNKQQCKVVSSDSSTKGLAVVGSTQNACYCISKDGRRILRPPTAAAAAEVCNPEKTVNFNQLSPLVGEPPPENGVTPPGTTPGNNGWGQEKHGKPADGTNPGSDDGNATQAGSKTASTNR